MNSARIYIRLFICLKFRLDFLTYSVALNCNNNIMLPNSCMNNFIQLSCLKSRICLLYQFLIYVRYWFSLMNVSYTIPNPKKGIFFFFTAFGSCFSMLAHSQRKASTPLCILWDKKYKTKKINFYVYDKYVYLTKVLI